MAVQEPGRFELAKDSGRLLIQLAAVVIGLILMVAGIGMGVSLVLLPIGIPVGLVGLLVFLWGIFGHHLREKR